MHWQYVEALVVEEGAALQDDVARGELLRVDRRGVLLIVEFRNAAYPVSVIGGLAVPLLGARQEQPAMRAAHELIAHGARLGRVVRGGTAQRPADEPRRHDHQRDKD